MFMFLTGHGQKIQRIQLVLQDSFCAEKALKLKSSDLCFGKIRSS